MTKTCSRCKLAKGIESFAKGRKYKDGYRGTCKRCHTDYMIAYYKKNETQRKIKNRLNSGSDTNWKRHKISKEKFEQMIAEFNGKCHTCKLNEARNIDHDHSCCPGNRSCGKCVRGILCNQCNTTLGLVKESKDVLENLIKYLQLNSAL